MRASGDLHIRLLIFVILQSKGCFGGDFDVVLIGFSSKDYECIANSREIRTDLRSTTEYPSLIWHRTGRIGKVPVGRIQTVDRSQHCIGRAQPAGTSPTVDALIKSILTNTTIASLITNRSKLICIGVSRLYSPVITWKAVGAPKKVLKVKTIMEPTSSSSNFPQFPCGSEHKTISVLQADTVDKMYECSLDASETCSIRRQCKRKQLLSRRMATRNDDQGIGTRKLSGIEHRNSTPMCAKFPTNFCWNLSSDGTAQFTSIVSKTIRSVVSSQSDLERICYFLYPACINQNDPSAGFVPICREDCFTLQFRYSSIWNTLTGHVANYLSPRRWTGCGGGAFPSVAERPPRCWQPQRKGYHLEKLNTECYETYDRHYVGYANRTIAGQACQRWDSLCPHYHEHWPEMYPELMKAENYCRNPGGVRQRPWCYTMDRNIRVDHCIDIPLCAKSHPSTEGPKKQHNGVMILSIVSGFIVFLSITLLYAWRKREAWTGLCGRSSSNTTNIRYRRSSDALALPEDIIVDQPQPTYHDHLSIMNLPPNELYFRNDPVIDRRLEALEMPRCWSVVRKLPSGEYSDIYLANLDSDSLTDSFQLTSRKIIAKTLKEPHVSWKMENFVQEACIASSCTHNRVVRVLGVCFITQPYYILFEYVPLGDLKSVLEAEAWPRRLESLAKHLDRYRPHWNPPLRHPKRLIDICYQIADGMVYISNQRIVHRDLAARNALMDERLQVKISDFGMAKRVDQVGGIHIVSDGESLPVRWTAPEALSTRQFSSKSDVWSYGVVVWEVLSFGQQPYIGMSHQEIVQMVVVHKQSLEASFDPFEETQEKQLVNSDAIINELMKPCFAYQPKERPDFITLLSKAAQLRALFE